MRRSLAFLLIAAAASSASAPSAAAQSDGATRFLASCQRGSWGNTAQFCDVRRYTLAPTGAITVDGRTNGGITVHGWDGNQVQVVAMVQGQAGTAADAQQIVNQVSVVASGSQIGAQGPDVGDRESWSVTYEVWVPRPTNLELRAQNGGIAVDNMQSTMRMRTQNGGLSLTDVGGDVEGTTVNGGITAELSGDHWVGAGLTLRTSNGGVRLTVPQNYSAKLETGTVNGSLNLGFPVTVQGRLNRQLSTQLGAGGAPVSITTTNGGVTIRRR